MSNVTVNDVIIVAPHADDELIGCFEVLESGIVTGVVVPNEMAAREIIPCSVAYGFRILNMKSLMGTWTNDPVFLFPDPFNELHPKHKYLGAKGLEFFREGRNVLFYTTSMNTTYLRETIYAEKKRDLLNRFYPEKSTLWEYDHKYFLFEGQVRYIRGWTV